MKNTVFKDIPIGGVYESLHLMELFMKEKNQNKVNMTVGAYRTEEGNPLVLPPIRDAELRLATDKSLNHEYLPVLGFEPFCKAATELLLGKNCEAVEEGRVTTIQCLSGTGSLRAGAEFLNKILGMNTIYVSDPTWLNHKMVCESAGFTDLRDYAYYNRETHSIDFEEMVKDLEGAPERSVIILHVCAHNPTGADLTRLQWMKIAEIIKTRGLFPFFDAAYLGFVSGDIEEDAWTVRYFAKQGIEMLIAQSFSKNMGLYNERVGSLTVVLRHSSAVEAVRSPMLLLISANWLTPPSHGAKVVHMVLTDPELRNEWKKCLKLMWSRIKEMRQALRDHLEKLGTPGTWDHITNQVGFFCYSGISGARVAHMLSVYKVFLLKDGRMNICGLNQNNVEYVAKAIDDAVRNVTDEN